MQAQAPGAMQRPLGPVLFAVVLVAAIVAGTIALSSRGDELVLDVSRLTESFRPAAEDGGEEAAIRFSVEEADPEARVEIVDGDGEVVRTLEASIALEADSDVAFRWDGRDDQGQLSPVGSYRLRVVLPGEDRDMIWPRRIELHG